MFHSVFERQLQVGLIQPEYTVRPGEQFDLLPGLICSYVLGAACEWILLVRAFAALGLGAVIIFCAKWRARQRQ